MKIAIISDTHFGLKNDHPFFIEESLKFFEEQFFPYIQENKIEEVIHLGDLMDRRKYINFNTLNRVRSRFISFFNKNNVRLHTVIGNHDAYYRNTNMVNSIQELFSESKNIIVYDEPTELNFDGLKIALIPWITNDNTNLCLDYIQNTSSSILAGHFEINGFEVVSGIYHSSGLESNIFFKFDKVLSGHFHIRQVKNNIHYVGTQYQMNFGDVLGKKGFNVLDTETREMTYIENKRRIFHIIKYDDVNGFEKIDPQEIRNCFVKVLVVNKKKPKAFESFIDILATCDLQELTVIEESEKYEESDNEIDMTQDTISIITKEVDNMNQVEDKQRLKLLLRELYMESMNI